MVEHVHAFAGFEFEIIINSQLYAHCIQSGE